MKWKEKVTKGSGDKQVSEREKEREKHAHTTSKSFLFNEISTCGKCSSYFWFSMSYFSLLLPSSPSPLLLLCWCCFFSILLFLFGFFYWKRYWKWTNWHKKNNDFQMEQKQSEINISANRIQSKTELKLNPTDDDKLIECDWRCGFVRVKINWCTLRCWKDKSMTQELI